MDATRTRPLTQPDCPAARWALLQPPRPRRTRLAMGLLAGLAAATVAALVLVGGMGGCSTASTRVTGERIDATHDVWSSGPRTEYGRRLRLRFDVAPVQPTETVAPAEPALAPSPASRPQSPAGGVSDSVLHGPVADPETLGGRIHGPSGAMLVVLSTAMLAAPPEQDELVPTPMADPELARMLQAAIDTGLPFEAEVEDYAITEGGSSSTRSTLSGEGPNVATSSGAGEVKTTGGLGKLDLPWGGSWAIDGLDFDAEVIAKAASSPLVWIGGVVLVAAVIPLLIRPRRVLDAAAIGGVGLVTIAAGVVHDQYPIAYLAALLAIAGLVGFLAYRSWRAGKVDVALDAIVPAIERSPNAPEIKGDIATRAARNTSVVRSVVRPIKAKQSREDKSNQAREVAA